MNVTDSEKKSKVTHDRTHPFPAKIIECTKLNKTGSSKENLHVVVDLTGSGITYEVGSSFGIYPENSPENVQEILDILSLDPHLEILDKRTQTPLSIGKFFSTRVNLNQITTPLFKLILEHETNPTLQNFIENKEAARAFIGENGVFSFLKSFWKRGIPPQQLADLLSPMLPRYYSIASSMTKVGSHAHFMVASFQYMQAGRLQQSVTSQFFKSPFIPGERSVSLFLHENRTFALPKDPNTPIIMIGPGTGLAVFRGFLQERVETQAPGKNWLFTGDRHRKYDFHYEEELTDWENRGRLKLSVAFSRDGLDKLYVQHLMLKQAEELWSWIKNDGATLYICGDAKNMAKDVQEALSQIAMIQEHLSQEEAKDLIKSLKKAGRLLLDVY